MQLVHIPTAKIQHPCNTWALSAGYESWNAALVDMRAGKVLCGALHSRSPGSKSMLRLQLFMEQVTNEKLHIAVSEVGGCLLGERERF